MEYVLTVAIPFCALLSPCAPREAVPLSPSMIHFGDCLGLQHLPVGGTFEGRQDQLPGGGRVVWPCGGKAR